MLIFREQNGNKSLRNHACFAPISVPLCNFKIRPNSIRVGFTKEYEAQLTY